MAARARKAARRMTKPPPYLTPDEGDAPLTRLLAPVLPRYRQLRALQEMPLALRGPCRNLILSHDRRLLFLRNQKCACTQTVQLMVHRATGAFWRGNVHRANRGILPARYRWTEIRPVLEAGSAYLFTFVRDPERRAHSAFRNFFVDRANLARTKHLPAMRARGYDPDRGAERNFDVFLDYVEECLALDPLRTDTHFRRQVDNIAFGKLPHDRIGRVESYARDIVEIHEAAGIAGFPPPELLAMRFNPSAPAASPPTPAQRARIRRIWAADYEAFGY